MDSLVSGLFIAATGIIYIIVGALASRGVSSTDDYLLGKRSFGVFSITFTLIATQLGAGMLFGTATEAYHNGFLGIAYILGMALGLLVLGLGVGAKLRTLEISTTAELFEKKYNSQTLRKFAAFISILTMGGILAAQMLASRQLFASLFTLSPWWLVAFWLMVIIYTMFGGIKAVIATDILQVIIIVVVFSAVVFYVIPASDFSKIIEFGLSKGDQPLFQGGFFAALIAPALFSIIEQDLAQRFFAAKTRRVATISALLSSAFLLIYAIVPITLGIYAHISGITYSAHENPLVLLLQSRLSHFGITMVACALLAAICSTADSLLGAASTNLIADFAKTNEKHSLLYSRLVTFLVGAVSLVVAFNFDGVISVIIKSYEVSISALFIPLIIAIYAKKPSQKGAYFSVILGFATFIVGNLQEMPVSVLLLALIASTGGYIAGTCLETWQKK